MHVPTLPGTLQAWHVAVQAPLQQTPSTQWPELHWLAAVQLCPTTRFGSHAPALQWLPALQSASEPQGFAQAPVPLQCASPHSPAGSVPAGLGVQVPMLPGALHTWHVPPQAALQHTPSTQCPELHSLAAAHPCPTPFFAVHAGEAQ
ncbi:MAG: hypothetical protein RL653_1630 [Pseudomonadota bacterium]